VTKTRTSPRAHVSLVARYRSPTIFDFVEEQCYDLSKGGMFIKSAHPAPIGTLLKIECEADGRPNAIRAVARVVWHREQELPNAPAGMGVKFVKLDPDSARTVEQIVTATGVEQEPQEGFERRVSTPPQKGASATATSAEPAAKAAGEGSQPMLERVSPEQTEHTVATYSNPVIVPPQFITTPIPPSYPDRQTVGASPVGKTNPATSSIAKSIGGPQTATGPKDIAAVKTPVGVKATESSRIHYMPPRKRAGAMLKASIASLAVALAIWLGVDLFTKEGQSSPSQETVVHQPRENHLVENKAATASALKPETREIRDNQQSAPKQMEVASTSRPSKRQAPAESAREINMAKQEAPISASPNANTVPERNASPKKSTVRKEKPPTPDALSTANACLIAGDNLCAIRALEGKAKTPTELGLLIESYRAVGEQELAYKNMDTYVRKYPTARRSAIYRTILEMRAR